MRLEQVVEVEPPGLLAFAVHRHRPGPRAQRVRVLGRVLLAGAKFVEVVVAGDLGEGIRLLRGRVAGVLAELEARHKRHVHDLRERRGRRRGDSGPGQAGQEAAPGQVHGLGRDVGRADARDAVHAYRTGRAGVLFHHSAAVIPRDAARRRARRPALTSSGSSAAARCGMSDAAFA